MKKTLIAMAVLAASSAAFAQTNVVIYGAVDINYVKETSKSITMNERYNNRIGFMGTEDLGGGLKATFQLEERFQLYSGKDKNSADRGDFEGAANVGLKGNFGHVRFGRVNELSTETYRQIDPFQQYGVAGMIETPLRGNAGEGRLGYTARYDSPNFNGFKLGVSYTVKNNSKSYVDYYGLGSTEDDNAGYAVSGTYTNGPLYLVANYNKAVNSLDSYNWNLGGAYAFGPAKLSMGYEQTRASDFADVKIKNWIIGLSYKVGAGVINASYNRSDMDALGSDFGSQTKYGIGYTHNLSKRTSVYANYAHTKYKDGYVSEFDNGPVQPNDSSSAVEIGITHKF